MSRAKKPDDEWVYAIVSTGCSALGRADDALAWVERGMARSPSVTLRTRLVVALLAVGRAADAVGVWEAHRPSLKPSIADPFYVANVLAAMARTGEHARAVDEVGPVVDAITSRRDGGLMRFNAACVASVAGEVERGLVWLSSALAEGSDPGVADTDGDLAAVRAHSAYALVRNREPVSRAWATEPVVELVLAGATVSERVYAAGAVCAVRAVRDDDLDSAGHACVEFSRRAAALDARAPACASPTLAYYRDALGEALTAFASAGVLDALVLEWDFADEPTTRRMWAAGGRASPGDAGAFDGYVCGDDVVVDWPFDGPPIETAAQFQAIVAELVAGEPFARLAKQTPFYFVFQEHDAGHIATVQWP